MHADEIGVLQELVQFHPRGAQLRFNALRQTAPVVIEDRHPKARCAPRHRLPDAAHADDAKGAAMHVVPQQDHQAPLFPLARADIAVRLGDASSDGKKQAPRQVAVDSVTTPGVLVTTTPCRVAAGTSTLS